MPGLEQASGSSSDSGRLPTGEPRLNPRDVRQGFLRRIKSKAVSRPPLDSVNGILASGNEIKKGEFVSEVDVRPGMEALFNNLQEDQEDGEGMTISLEDVD